MVRRNDVFDDPDGQVGKHSADAELLPRSRRHLDYTSSEKARRHSGELTDHTNDLNHGAEICRVFVSQALEDGLEEDRAGQFARPDD